MNRASHVLLPLLSLLSALLPTLLTRSHARADAFKQRLEQGEIIVYTTAVKGSDTPMMVVKAVINAPPRKVWDVVRACWNYSRTMPRIKAGKLVKRVGNKYYCKVTVDMPFPYSDVTSTTEAVHTELGKDRFTRRWTLQSGDYKQNSGAWILAPFAGDPKRTYVIYRIHAVPKAYVPGWIRRAAQKSSLPKMIEQIRVLVR